MSGTPQRSPRMRPDPCLAAGSEVFRAPTPFMDIEFLYSKNTGPAKVQYGTGASREHAPQGPFRKQARLSGCALAPSCFYRTHSLPYLRHRDRSVEHELALLSCVCVPPGPIPTDRSVQRIGLEATLKRPLRPGGTLGGTLDGGVGGGGLGGACRRRFILPELHPRRDILRDFSALRRVGRRRYLLGPLRVMHRRVEGVQRLVQGVQRLVQSGAHVRLAQSRDRSAVL
mmetsp:Transcript_43007/g.115951  ORF Transcript_43007/g.115951 Transcript_43007/m.115951 type:complete len:228 (+) Transcript_43007:652-1335(+)